MKRVDIHRLNIRLKGVPAAAGKTAVSTLNQTLAAHLAAPRPGSGTIRVTAVTSNPIQLPRKSSAADINRHIAQAVAEVIAARLSEKEKYKP